MKIKNSGIAAYLNTAKVRGLSLLLVVICLLAGCVNGDPTGGTSSSGKEDSTSSESESKPDNSSENQEVNTKEETVIEYYDGEYTTNPDSWATDSGGKRTVQNLPSYSFNEQEYLTVAMSGGTDIRTENFIRGMGNTFYHSEEGWNISAATRALDEANLNELNVTDLRAWGFIEELFKGMKICGDAFNTRSFLPSQSYGDGKKGLTSQLALPNAKQAILDTIFNPLSNFMKDSMRNVTKIALLGNEYRIIERDGSGNWTYCGYDDVTLNDFRKNWLPARFKTIANLNKLCSTDFTSFNDVYPKVGVSKLFYEFWLYQRQTFRDVMKSTVESSKQRFPSTDWGYAGICSADDPLGNNLYLDFLDYTSQNLYFNWFNSFHEYAFQLDNLTAWSETAPVVITEYGFMNGETEELNQLAARRWKQQIALLYMRPRVVGGYAFNYTIDAPDVIYGATDWGLVKPDRTRYPAFDAVAQIHTDLKYLDKYYTGASNTPLVALSNQSTDRTAAGNAGVSSGVAAILYSQGVPIQIVPSDDSARFDRLEEKKLIYNDVLIYQEPNGNKNVGTALEGYMKNGGNILRTTKVLPEPLYGMGDDFAGSSVSDMEKRYPMLEIKNISTKDKELLKDKLLKFVHKDFVEGRVNKTKNKIDESAVRVLEINARNTVEVVDPTWDISAQMIYRNGEIYLCLINNGEKVIDNVNVTVGVNSGIRCNFNPRILRADGSVVVSRPQRAEIPTWIDSSVESKTAYGTVSVSNLNTYAFIHIGKAVTK